MECKKCNSCNGSVKETRLTRGGSTIRRRRVCLDCGHRYTTYEVRKSVFYSEHLDTIKLEDL